MAPACLVVFFTVASWWSSRNIETTIVNRNINRNLTFMLLGIVVAWTSGTRADVVTDWNTTLNEAIVATPSKHNPGNPTRAMAMTNAAIYDVFQAINRTHAPFKVNTLATLNFPGANLNAAVAQAAYRTISETYGEQQATLDSIRATRLAGIVDTPQAIQAGIDLGNYVAQHYITTHANDGWDQPDSYTPVGGPGHWSEDPLHAPQKGWGKAWGTVTPWVMQNSDQFDGQFEVLGLPGLGTQAYVDAFNQVKAYGALNSAVRDSIKTDQTQIGIFWAYDRPNIVPDKLGNGPPPVLFTENLMDIAAQTGNTPAQNARLFALASVSMADAAIAAWDVKFETDFWRPITAIRGNPSNDGNPLTVEDPNWVPLGAPGSDPGSSADDFTPPFPAYTSGHATMGGAVFKALQLFYGTNIYDEIDGIIGNDLDYTLHSKEVGGGGTRSFDKFTQTVPLTVGTENSPEGENAISRIYLGIHWLFDATDGTKLGNLIANYAYQNHFQAVPEPDSLLLVILGSAWIGCGAQRRK